jgi:hypothetical protein
MSALHATFLDLGTSRHVDAGQLLLRARGVAQRLYLQGGLVALSPVSHATDAKRQAWLHQAGSMFAA